MAALFDQDKYFSTGEWKVAANSASSHYEKLGFRPGDTLSDKQIIEAFHLREDWWTQKDKIARRGQAHPVIKEVGPFIPDAIKNLIEAKKNLSDPVKKAQYDKILNDEIVRKNEEDLIRFIHFALQGDNMISEEEMRNLLNMADTLKIGRDKGKEIILYEMEKAGATFKPESDSGNTTSSSTPTFDIILNKTYYEILGVSEDAGYAEIKNAFDIEYKKYDEARDKKRAGARWIPVSEAWECLRDKTKKRKYDEEQKRKRDKDLTDDGGPKLEIKDESGNERRNYEFKDMRLGIAQSVTVIAKNGGGGTLDASIKTSHPWLIVDTNKIHQSKLPHEIIITVDPKRNPSKNTFGGKDNGQVEIVYKNGHYTINIAYKMIEDEADLKRFRKGVTIGGLVLGFIIGSLIYNYFIEGTSNNIIAENVFRPTLIAIAIVGSIWGYKDAGRSGAFGWGCGTFMGGLIILSILKAWFPHTFSTVAWSLIYGSVANITSDFIRRAIRQENYQVPIGVGIGMLVLPVMLVIIGTEGARKERNTELSRSKAVQNTFQTISKKITGDWEGNIENKHAKLTIDSNGKYIIYDNVKEYLALSIYGSKNDLAYEEFILKGTNFERLKGKDNFNLDTFYGKIAKDGRSISGNYVDTAGNKGNWSVTKHEYAYKNPKKTYTAPQKSMDEAQGTNKSEIYTKGGFGIAAQNITAQLQKSLGLKGNIGVLVVGIEPNSPAAKAGIKSGDVLIKYNDIKIKDPLHLFTLGLDAHNGVPIGVIRDGKELTLNTAILKSPKTSTAKVMKDTEKEKFVDTDQIKSKIKIIQRKLDDLSERYQNTGKSISSMDMKTDSSEMAYLEVERKEMAKEIRENNIQKGQLLDGLSARGGEDGENWSTHKEPIEKASASIHKTPTSDKQSVNNFPANKHQPSTVGDNYANVTRVKLRSSPNRSLCKDDVKDILGRYNLYDSVWNTGGDFTNNYEAQVINGGKVVIDHATGLMWHQSGSLQTMNWGETYQWVRELNRMGYAGYQDWRLPTIDEAVTLLESRKYGGENGLYIDPVFDSSQKMIWTSDEKAKTEKMRLGKFNIGTSTSSSRHWWCVNFTSGTVSWLIKLIELNKHVRPVRTMR